MAQDSFPWDGTTVGHAVSTDVWSAPYNSAEYSDVYHKLLGSLNPYVLVIPNLLNNLIVVANSPAAMNVRIKSGVAFLAGKVYENTATETIVISTADATNPRIDRIVLRITYDAGVQTTTIAVLTGTPAATPSLPTLTQSTTTWEVSIAYVWIAASATTIVDTDIHDERLFAYNLWEGHTNGIDNLIQNSEFMAFSRLSTVPSTSAGRPDGWDLVGTATFASATKPSQMSRGRAIQVTAGANSSGISQTFSVKSSAVFYSIRGLVNVTAGDNAEIVVTTNSASPNTIRRYIKRTGAWIEFYIYYPTESDATTMTISLLAKSNTDIVEYGQALVTEGYTTGPFRQIHEIVFFDHGVGDSNWNNTTKSSGTTTIDLDTDFQSIILPGTRATYVYISDQDSGSLANSASISLRAKGGSLSIFTVGTNAEPNGTQRLGTGWVPVDINMQFDVLVVASGVLTTTAQLRVEGISI
jgi:hypothetical protein